MKRFFVGLTLMMSFAACKQGDGDVCQVDSDCASGLTCTSVGGQTLQHCVRTGGGDDGGGEPPDASIDASSAIDAAPIDALPIDAAP